jgi:hypothetical protein
MNTASSAITSVSLIQIGHNAIDEQVNAVCVKQISAYVLALVRCVKIHGLMMGQIFFLI